MRSEDALSARVKHGDASPDPTRRGVNVGHPKIWMISSSLVRRGSSTPPRRPPLSRRGPCQWRGDGEKPLLGRRLVGTYQLIHPYFAGIQFLHLHSVPKTTRSLGRRSVSTILAEASISWSFWIRPLMNACCSLAAAYRNSPRYRRTPGLQDLPAFFCRSTVRRCSSSWKILSYPSLVMERSPSEPTSGMLVTKSEGPACQPGPFSRTNLG